MEHSLLQLIYAQVPQAGVNHFGQSIIVTLIHLLDIICIAFTFLNVPCSFVDVMAHQKYALTPVSHRQVFFCMAQELDRFIIKMCICQMLENELLNENVTLHTLYTFQNMQVNSLKCLKCYLSGDNYKGLTR